MPSYKSDFHALYIMAALAVLIIVIWYFLPIGRIFLYPFVILCTWFHEMGHGLTALLLGGHFDHLEMYWAGGVAYWSGNVFGGPIGRAIVAFAGPVAPTSVGSCFLLLSRKKSKKQLCRMINLLFAVVIIVSIIIWVRSLFGIVAIGIFGVAFFCSAVWGNEKFNSVVLQFISVQALMSIYLNLFYFFTPSLPGEKGMLLSDTGVISQCLLLPYWFWGGAVCLFSVLSIIFCVKKLTYKATKR